MNKKYMISQLSYAAIIASLYIVLTYVFAPISFGVIQFRVSEILCILPVFTPAAIPGLFLGCFLANILTGAVLIDIIFGSLATLIGAFGSYLLRKTKYLYLLPPILANAVIIPFVLIYGYGIKDIYIFLFFTIGFSEAVTVAIFGNVLKLALEKYRGVLVIK